MNKEEQEILKLNDPQKSYFYCLNNENTANIKAHEKIILDSKEYTYCTPFAKYMPGANIKAHEQLIIESKDPRYCYLFAYHIKKSNKQLLSEIVLFSLDLDCINLFYNNIDFDKTKYNNLFIFI